MQQICIYVHIQIPSIILFTVFFKHSQCFEGSKYRIDGTLSQFKLPNNLDVWLYLVTFLGRCFVSALCKKNVYEDRE